MTRRGPIMITYLFAVILAQPTRAQEEDESESEPEAEDEDERSDVSAETETESESESESENETEPEAEDETESEPTCGGPPRRPTESEDETETTLTDEELVEIRAARPKRSATEDVISRDEIESFPHRDAEDLLRLSPGMHLSAHGGRGKAYQIFVRGFDAVHGSDVAVSLEGIPLNEASHIHGQGYLDLHFIPPDAVLELDLAKGAVRADRGDFAIAASADYHVGLAEPGLRMGAGGGTDRSLRAVTAFRPPGSGEDSFVVADGEWSQGAGEGRGYRAVRALGGMGGDVSDVHL